MTTLPPRAGSDIPDVLIKTTLGCSLVMIAILIPFTINNVLQGRAVLTVATSSVALACSANVWFGLRGRYSLGVNTWLVTPSAVFTIAWATLRLGEPASYWPFLLVLSFYFVLPERRAWLFNALALAIFLPMAWRVLEPSSAVRFSAVLLGVSLFAYLAMREIYTLHGLLKAQAVTDELTGLFNRVLLEDSLRQAIAQHERSDVPMTLVALDIDHFKSINDSLGHDAGDQVLRALADLLRKRIRASDLVFRVGGEEFLLLAHGTGEDAARELAESLRAQIEAAALLPDRTVTISVGVAGLDADMDTASWVRASDERLYRAKEGGRNRVVA